MKPEVTNSFLVGFAIFLLMGCHTDKNKPVVNPPANSSYKLEVTNIEIRPNPYHLWPNTNFKPGDCSVIIRVMNSGNVTCTSDLAITVKFIKADSYGNFNSAGLIIGGSLLTGGIMPNESRYVIIPYDTWLILQTAQGDFSSVLGTYKVIIALTGDSHIDENIPKPLLVIIGG